MNTPVKKSYLAPENLYEEVSLEAVICDSTLSGIDALREDYGDAVDQEW